MSEIIQEDGAARLSEGEPERAEGTAIPKENVGTGGSPVVEKDTWTANFTHNVLLADDARLFNRVANGRITITVFNATDTQEVLFILLCKHHVG